MTSKNQSEDEIKDNTKKEQEKQAEQNPEQNQPSAEIKEEVKIKQKRKEKIRRGVAHIQSTFNNTLITISDASGKAICWASAGGMGFKGSKKGTAFAAQMAAESCAKKALDNGVEQIEVYVKGPGAGRESAIRALQSVGLEITVIKDVTPIPHNGCRPRKRRRV